MKPTIKLFLLIVIIATAFFFFSTKYPLTNQADSDTITQPSDLDRASDQLQLVDLDSMDGGLQELNQEVGTF